MRYFLDLLSVTTHYLSCPSQGIFRPDACRLSCQPKLQILRIVVCLVPVDMVNAFIRVQRATKFLFHHMTVLKHPLAIDPDSSIPIRGQMEPLQRQLSAVDQRLGTTGIAMLPHPVIVHRAPSFGECPTLTSRSRALVRWVSDLLRPRSIQMAPTKSLRNIRSPTSFNRADDLRQWPSHKLSPINYFFDTSRSLAQ